MREEYIVKSHEDMQRVIVETVDKRLTYYFCKDPYWDLETGYPLDINLLVKRGARLRPKKGLVYFFSLHISDPTDPDFETEREDRRGRFYVQKRCFPLRDTLLPDIQILPIVIAAYRKD